VFVILADIRQISDSKYSQNTKEMLDCDKNICSTAPQFKKKRSPVCTFVRIGNKNSTSETHKVQLHYTVKQLQAFCGRWFGVQFCFKIKIV